MFSVLIPIYNYSISNLVQPIYYQLKKQSNNFEIILVDDFSQLFKEENKKFATGKDNIILIELPQNIGRAKIRNYLAEKAKYEYLIFLDCDVLVNEYFISNYLQYIKHDVVCGGRNYLKNKPSNEFILHWKYGRIKEHKAQKNKKFFSTNFFIKKEVFEQIKFDESINGYGHEDTIFAIDLKKRNFKIEFIDNPVFHIGLDSNENFIKKTENWISNSQLLINKYRNLIIEEITLYKVYYKISKLGLTCLLLMLYKILHRIIRKKLLNKNPKIFFLDIYKLLFLAKILKTNESN